jgi:uncharacterized protein
MSETVLTDAASDPSTDARPQAGTKTRRVAVITGASGGIGADLARVFARHGHDLVLIARSAVALEALADEIAVSGRPRPLVLVFDLLERNATDQIAAALEAASVSPEILVNNAGFGLIGPAEGLDPAEQLGIIDLNIRAVVALTLRLLPAIRAARGKILNGVDRGLFSWRPRHGGLLRLESLHFIVLARAFAGTARARRNGLGALPWLHQTGFQARAGIGPNIDLTRLPGATAMEVAEAGYAGLIAGRREIVPGFLNKFSVLLLPFLPKAVILAVISRLQQNRSPLR